MLTLPETVAVALREQVVASLATPQRFTSSISFLLRETAGLPNMLGSFLGGDGHVLLASVFGTEVLAAMMPKSPKELFTASIADLSVAPENSEAWRTLAITIADHPLRPDCASIFDEFLAGFDLQKILRLLSAKEGELLPFLCARCALAPSLPLRSACEEHIFTSARQAAQSDLGDAKLHERVALHAACLILLAVVPGDEAASHERMHKLLVRLLQTWPAAASILRRRFDGWPIYVPLARQRGLWELEMSLRALR